MPSLRRVAELDRLLLGLGHGPFPAPFRCGTGFLPAGQKVSTCRSWSYETMIITPATLQITLAQRRAESAATGFMPLLAFIGGGNDVRRIATAVHAGDS